MAQFGLVYGIFSYLLFFITILYMIGFTGNFAVPKSVDMGGTAGGSSALIINLVLIALFGIQHSVMARPKFKEKITKSIPKSMERSTFVLVSSLILILLYCKWQPMPRVMWDYSDSHTGNILWGVFTLGWIMVFVATFQINHFDLFGLRQVYMEYVGKPYKHVDFKITGFYKYVRHPIMLGFLLAFWAAPTMTSGHFLFAGGMTLYILIGLAYEERDLISYWGKKYKEYQKSTPMLIPFKVEDSGESSPDEEDFQERRVKDRRNTDRRSRDRRTQNAGHKGGERRRNERRSRARRKKERRSGKRRSRERRKKS